MRFRPCIDIHDGRVKQIVGGTLRDDAARLETNFVSEYTAAHYAELYARDGLTGGHVIMLGKGNENAARAALQAAPGTLQIGGGITPDNANEWLDAGASKVIVTSFVFQDGVLSSERLTALAAAVGRERLVLDLSCRLFEGAYHVACNRWQTLCETTVTPETCGWLGQFCSEFLIHAVDVEGRQAGIETDLVALLAECCELPMTYAGGIHCQADLDTLASVGKERLDFTVGSALDIFGGTGLKYEELVNRYISKQLTTSRNICLLLENKR